MIRALSILAAIVALVTSAVPVASAGSSNQPTPRTFGAGKDRGWVKSTSKQPPRGFKLDIDVEALDVVKARSTKGQRPAGDGIIAVLIG